MFQSLRNMFKVPELRRRILITLGLLVVYRLGCTIPVPGVDTAELARWAAKAQSGLFGGIFGMINLFTGNAFSQLALFAMGVMPYISASIIIQLLTTSVPYLEALAKEGEAGRKKIRRIERYLTLALCVFQAYVLVKGIETMSGVGAGERSNIIAAGIGTYQFELMAVLALTAGSIFLMWIGEQMTEYGIGNGISMIIMAGIIARIPVALREIIGRTDWTLSGGEGRISLFIVVSMALLLVAIIMGVVLVTQAQRRIPMQQAKQMRGRRVVGGQRHYMPLRVNQAGVIPIIFASSLLLFPMIIINAINSVSPSMHLDILAAAFNNGSGFVYLASYAALIIFFCFFWTAVTFNPKQMSENLMDYGSFIPGIRPGTKTSEYLEHVMTRVTLAGAAFLAVIAVLPNMLSGASGFDTYVAGFYGGTGLLIVVGVALDLVEQIETHLLMRHYEGFMRKGRIRGRRG